MASKVCRDGVPRRAITPGVRRQIGHRNVAAPGQGMSGPADDPQFVVEELFLFEHTGVEGRSERPDKEVDPTTFEFGHEVVVTALENLELRKRMALRQSGHRIRHQKGARQRQGADADLAFEAVEPFKQVSAGAFEFTDREAEGAGRVLAGRREPDCPAAALEKGDTRDGLSFPCGPLDGRFRLPKSPGGGAEAAMGKKGSDRTQVRPGQQRVEPARQSRCCGRMSDELGNAPEPDDRRFALGRERHVRAADQGRPKCGFQRMYRLRCRRLGDPQRLRRCRKRALVGESYKEPDMAQIGKRRRFRHWPG